MHTIRPVDVCVTMHVLNGQTKHVAAITNRHVSNHHVAIVMVTAAQNSKERHSRQCLWVDLPVVVQDVRQVSAEPPASITEVSADNTTQE